MIGRAKPLHVGALAVLAAALLGPAGGTAGATPPDSRVIPAGVSAGGIDISNLTVDAAAQKLQATAGSAVGPTILIGVGGRLFRLAPAQAAAQLDGLTTAKRALSAAERTPGQPVSVPLALTHSHAAVVRFVGSIGQRVDAPARNATMQITLTHIYLRRSRPGHHVDQPALVRQLDTLLDNPAQPRVLHLRVVKTRPAINANRLIQLNSTVVTIDRAHFKLRLFKFLRVVSTYGIAVGRSGLETPTGIYHVQEREVNPSWHVPNAPWAGALAGQTIPPGPNDPIVARWLGLGGGVGIHGTNEPFSIGSAASHGCIRMLVPDVINLYPRVPMGTTVFIR